MNKECLKRKRQRQADNSKDKFFKEKSLWIDPLINDPPGILLSDKIVYYYDRCRLVYPFERDPEKGLLRPAAYTLCVGDAYYMNGKECALSPGEEIVVPPNGLVYIRTYECLNIPYYMVARYSLRVAQVYRGMMLDNGLQIDPGYHGHINVPIYNFTDEERKFKYQEKLLSIEFTRTTSFLPGDNKAFNNAQYEKDWIGEELKGWEGNPLVVFRYVARDLYNDRKISDYFKGEEKHVSAVSKLREEWDKFNKRFDVIKWEVVIAIFGIIITIAIGVIPLIIAVRESVFAQDPKIAGQERMINSLNDNYIKWKQKQVKNKNGEDFVTSSNLPPIVEKMFNEWGNKTSVATQDLNKKLGLLENNATFLQQQLSDLRGNIELIKKIQNSYLAKQPSISTGEKNDKKN